MYSHRSAYHGPVRVIVTESVNALLLLLLIFFLHKSLDFLQSLISSMTEMAEF